MYSSTSYFLNESPRRTCALPCRGIGVPWTPTSLRPATLSSCVPSSLARSHMRLLSTVIAAPVCWLAHHLLGRLTQSLPERTDKVHGNTYVSLWSLLRRFAHSVGGFPFPCCWVVLGNGHSLERWPSPPLFQQLWLLSAPVLHWPRLRL